MEDIGALIMEIVFLFLCCAGLDILDLHGLITELIRCKDEEERNEKEEELWAHDPDTGERTFYLGCLI